MRNKLLLIFLLIVLVFAKFENFNQYSPDEIDKFEDITIMNDRVNEDFNRYDYNEDQDEDKEEVNEETNDDSNEEESLSVTAAPTTTGPAPTTLSSNFDDYKLAGFTCRIRRLTMNCIKKFDLNKKRGQKCSAILSNIKKIGGRKTVTYSVLLCANVKQTKSLTSSLVKEFCLNNAQSCEKNKLGYSFVKNDLKSRDAYFTFASKIDLNQRSSQIEADVKKSLELFSPIPGFNCTVKNKSNKNRGNKNKGNKNRGNKGNKGNRGNRGNKNKKRCSKNLGYLGNDNSCTTLFSGSFLETNATSFTKYSSRFCLKKSQRKSLKKTASDLRRSVVNDYCSKYKNDCNFNGNRTNYIRDHSTIARYQIFVLTAEPSVNVTAIPEKKTHKYFFGGFGNGKEKTNYKTATISFPVIIDGKNVTVTRNVKIDLKTGEFFFVPSTTPTEKAQDSQIQTQLNQNPQVASAVTARVAANSGTMKVLSVAFIVLSSLVFAFA